MSEYSVRKITKPDEAAAKLMHYEDDACDVFVCSRTHWVRLVCAGLTAMTEHDENVVEMWVIEDDGGDMVSYAIIQLPTPGFGVNAHVLYFWPCPKPQVLEQGVKTMMEDLRSRGIMSLEIQTQRESLYEKLGFKTIGAWMVYER